MLLHTSSCHWLLEECSSHWGQKEKEDLAPCFGNLALRSSINRWINIRRSPRIPGTFPGLPFSGFWFLWVCWKFVKQRQRKEQVWIWCANEGAQGGWMVQPRPRFVFLPSTPRWGSISLSVNGESSYFLTHRMVVRVKWAHTGKASMQGWHLTNSCGYGITWPTNYEGNPSRWVLLPERPRSRLCWTSAQA